MNYKRFITFVFICVQVPTMSAMSSAQPQNKSEWDLWKDKVCETILPMFADVQKKHPEYQSTAADKPCEVTFDVNCEKEVTNIHCKKTSGFKDFDAEVSSIIFFARNSLAFSFPLGITDKFVKCSLCFYPHGKVSKLELTHPRPGEVFENKSSISVPVESHQSKSPPDVVSY